MLNMAEFNPLFKELYNVYFNAKRDAQYREKIDSLVANCRQEKGTQAADEVLATFNLITEILENKRDPVSKEQGTLHVAKVNELFANIFASELPLKENYLLEILLIFAINNKRQDLIKIARLQANNKREELDKVILDKVIEINTSQNGEPALIKAVKDNAIENVIALLYLGADPNIRDIDDNPTLVHVVNEKILTLLLENGADIDIQDPSGCTILMIAILNENEKLVELLLEKGADINIQDIYGQTALEYAKKSHNPKILDLFFIQRIITENKRVITDKEFLEEFPPDQLFRLFVNGDEQHEGWKNFEMREPGYLQAMFHAFFTELSNYKLNTPLSEEDICRMHFNAINGVANTNYDKNECYDPTIINNNTKGHFDLFPACNLSKNGYLELLRGDYCDFVINQKRIFSDKNPEIKVKKALEVYHAQMQNAKNIETKIEAIVEMVSRLERIHPFADGNCRTFCMLVLHLELLKLGFPPPILDNPNQFDGYSKTELCQKIKTGIQRTKEIIETGKMKTPIIINHFEYKGRVIETSNREAEDMIKCKMKEKPLVASLISPKGEQEDSLVYQAIYFEALEKSKVEKNDPEFKKYQQQYLNNLKLLAENLSQGQDDAFNKLTEMIKFGCKDQIRKIFEFDVLNKDKIAENTNTAFFEKMATIYQNCTKLIYNKHALDMAKIIEPYISKNEMTQRNSPRLG